MKFLLDIVVSNKLAEDDSCFLWNRIRRNNYRFKYKTHAIDLVRAIEKGDIQAIRDGTELLQNTMKPEEGTSKPTVLKTSLLYEKASSADPTSKFTQEQLKVGVVHYLIINEQWMSFEMLAAEAKTMSVSSDHTSEEIARLFGRIAGFIDDNQDIPDYAFDQYKSDIKRIVEIFGPYMESLIGEQVVSNSINSLL